MAGNGNLGSAKIKKNDEFYTRYADIEAEMNAYVDYNPDVFRGKTILLPCDDPEWSNFTKYFANNFTTFGIKKLISTSYVKSAGSRQLTFFEESSPVFDKKKHKTKGKLFTLTRDTNGSGQIDSDDIELNGYLEGDGDFRSDEVTKLRDEADIIITNPPFSLFREFLAWIIEGGKQFIIIGNKNAITYKEVFPLIKNNQMWVGFTPMGRDLLFTIPKSEQAKMLNSKRLGSGYRIVDGEVMGRSQSIWFANIEHGKRHSELMLDTKAHHLKYHKRLQTTFETEYGKLEYPHYDNYDAIEVPYVDAIPSDYAGVMGVPKTFLDKYNPDQFEIIGTSQSWDKFNSKQYAKQIQVSKNGTKTEVTKLNDGPAIELEAPPAGQTYYIVDGKYYVQTYARILIRNKHPQTQKPKKK